jgi:CheY-like chemotaxis protein
MLRLNHDAQVMTKHLAESFVDLRRHRLAAKPLTKLRLDHVKRRFDIAALVIVAQELSEAVLPERRGNETILLVEDEPMVRELSRQFLEEYGYRVLTAANGRDGLEVFQDFPDRIDLIVTDVVMPQMSGRELVEKARQLRPNTQVLYMSGFTDDAIGRHGVIADDFCFIQKPFSPDALARKVREILDSSSAGASDGLPIPRNKPGEELRA